MIFMNNNVNIDFETYIWMALGHPYNPGVSWETISKFCNRCATVSKGEERFITNISPITLAYSTLISKAVYEIFHMKEEERVRNNNNYIRYENEIKSILKDGYYRGLFDETIFTGYDITDFLSDKVSKHGEIYVTFKNNEKYHAFFDEVIDLKTNQNHLTIHSRYVYHSVPEYILRTFSEEEICEIEKIEKTFLYHQMKYDTLITEDITEKVISEINLARKEGYYLKQISKANNKKKKKNEIKN